MPKLSGGLTDNEKVIVEALAGAIGGFAGAVAFYPLDTVKTRIQATVGKERARRKTWLEVFSELVEKEGPLALFAGVGAKGVQSWTSSFIYFLAFSSLRRAWEARTGSKIGMRDNLVVAAMAGCCNVLITEPLDTLSTRRQITSRPEPEGEGDTGDGAGGNAGTVQREDLSWHSLYSGIGASLMLTINPAIQYTVFEQLRQRVIASLTKRAVRRGKKPVVELSASDAFVLGATSKAIATFITYPLIRAKVLAKTKRFEGRSIPGTISDVARMEGAAGLYKGLEAQLLKTVLASAFTLTIKEKSFRTAMLVVLLVNRA